MMPLEATHYHLAYIEWLEEGRPKTFIEWFATREGIKLAEVPSGFYQFILHLCDMNMKDYTNDNNVQGEN